MILDQIKHIYEISKLTSLHLLFCSSLPLQNEKIKIIKKKKVGGFPKACKLAAADGKAFTLPKPRPPDYPDTSALVIASQTAVSSLGLQGEARKSAFNIVYFLKTAL